MDFNAGSGKPSKLTHRMSHFIHICRGSPRLVVLVLKAFERLQVFEVKSESHAGSLYHVKLCNSFCRKSVEVSHLARWSLGSRGQKTSRQACKRMEVV